jgi:hypothetical protein
MNSGLCHKPFEHGRADFLRQRVAFGQLQVVLGFRRLVTGGDLAVRPLGLLQSFRRMRSTSSRVNRPGNVQEHGVATQDRKRKRMVVILIGCVKPCEQRVDG